jgi:hypothetical protein
MLRISSHRIRPHPEGFCMKLLVSSLIVASLAVLACSQAVRTPEGAEKGKCYGNQICNSGLICDKSSNICVRDSGSGGSSGSGGNNETGGSGGTSDTGGSGGTSETGGASGGSGGSGGGSGGTSDTGGSQSGGASGGSGGTPSSGGSSGSGGSSSTTTNACNATASANSVAFCNGQALGAMTGWGWVALGSADTLTDPTCDTAKAAITSAAPCKSNTNWSKPDSLCMTGSVPALPGDAGAADYSSNWGVQIGVNAKDPNAAMGSSWKTVTLSVSGAPTTGLRAILHKSGDGDTVGYCKEMTPGTAMAITDFNSQCWNSGGTSLTEADAASIDKVGVQVTSTAAAISVNSLCLTKIEFGM